MCMHFCKLIDFDMHHLTTYTMHTMYMCMPYIKILTPPYGGDCRLQEKQHLFSQGMVKNLPFSINSCLRNENLTLLVRIKLLNLFYIYLNKNWKFTGPNKVLLVLCRRTGIVRTDIRRYFYNKNDHIYLYD